MKAKVLSWLGTLLVLAVALSVGAGLSRAESDPPQQEPPANGAPGKVTKINKKEEEAYKVLYAARGDAWENQIKLGENFVNKFPQSHYLAGVYAQLTTAYFKVGQNEKMYEAGNKALELNPNNVDILALFAMAIPRHVTSATPDAAEQYRKAEGYARRAIELIPNLQKSDEIDDATFEKGKNDELSMAHSGLGLIAFRRQKYEEARTELMQAVQLASSPDPVDYYILGNADVQASYYNDAVAAFEKCALDGPLIPQCKAGADRAKQDAATKLGR
jgi:tetratricopeptide (TPR) repeat protein